MAREANPRATSRSLSVQPTGSAFSFSQWTLSAWVKLSSNSTGGASWPFLAVYDSASAFNRNTAQIRFISSNAFNVATGSSSAITNVSDTATPSTDVWYHVAATRSGSTVRLYVDGVNVASNSSAVDFSTNPNTIGILRDSANGGRAAISHAAIWNAPLTAEEIAALAARASPLRIGRNSDLRAYWPLSLGDNSGTRSEPAIAYAAGENYVLAYGGASPALDCVPGAPVEAPRFGGRRIWVPYVIQGGAPAEVIGSAATLTLEGQTGTIVASGQIVGNPANLTLEGQPGAIVAAPVVTANPAQLTLTGQKGTITTGDIVQADFGGHFGVTKRRRRLPKNDRAEIRELLEEVLASPAAPEVREVLDAAVPMRVKRWSAPPVKALDALMGQADVLQQIIRLQWAAEVRAEEQREEEEQMLLLMML